MCASFELASEPPSAWYERSVHPVLGRANMMFCGRDRRISDHPIPMALAFWDALIASIPTRLHPIKRHNVPSMQGGMVLRSGKGALPINGIRRLVGPFDLVRGDFPVILCMISLQNMMCSVDTCRSPYNKCIRGCAASISTDSTDSLPRSFRPTTSPV